MFRVWFAAFTKKEAMFIITSSLMSAGAMLVGAFVDVLNQLGLVLPIIAIFLSACMIYIAFTTLDIYLAENTDEYVEEEVKNKKVKG